MKHLYTTPRSVRVQLDPLMVTFGTANLSVGESAKGGSHGK